LRPKNGLGALALRSHGFIVFSRFNFQVYAFQILPLAELENGCYVVVVTESGKPGRFPRGSLDALQKQLCLKTSETATAGAGTIPIIQGADLLVIAFCAARAWSANASRVSEYFTNRIRF
jgi:hypothetical protein